ncbi:serine/threonine-protein kinase [Tanacetum coccineum]
MSSLTRVWMAAGVAVVNGHTDQGCKLKSLVKSIRQSKKAFTLSNGADSSYLRPFSSFNESRVTGGDKKTQADDSLRQVMYLSCWGPS